MSGVYDAYASRLGFQNVKLQINENTERELFADYREAEEDSEKAKKVLKTIRRELGAEAYETICRAAASRNEEKADAIFRTIVLGLHLPKKQQVMNCLTEEAVCTVAALGKKTWNEAHRFMGFVRFQELSGKILYAEIRPENDILPLIAPHFADRFPLENWIIYDEGRKKSIVHGANRGWILLENRASMEMLGKECSEEEDSYASLWKVFTESIAIEARKNEKLQKQLLPLKFRDKMTEFKER